jgi:signal transduction histidine kinase
MTERQPPAAGTRPFVRAAGPAAPSIGDRLVVSLWWWALIGGAVLCLAAWMATRHELDELLDDSLMAAAHGMWEPLSLATASAPGLVSGAAAARGPARTGVPATPADAEQPGDVSRFVWQLVHYGAAAQLQAASAGGPTAVFHTTPTAGLSVVQGWRVAGVATAQPGQMLYVAQARQERAEAQAELVLAVALATLPLAALALWWMREHIRSELLPLQRLSHRLTGFDPALPAGAVQLGVAERSELQPVHAALDQLTTRLAQRMLQERAFSAHAAHALRTPLAGIDAQLAVALVQAPPELQARLQRVRGASQRLQRVVAALLTLFRSGAELQRGDINLAELAARLPVHGLAVSVSGPAQLRGDADLVAAALLNLLDNALRHGAHQVVLSAPQPHRLRVQDDGPGVSEGRRLQLQAALQAAAVQLPVRSAAESGHGAPDGSLVVDDAARADGQARFADRSGGDAALGLGLTLAVFVARAHGGQVHLPATPAGFAIELWLHDHATSEPGA